VRARTQPQIRREWCSITMSMNIRVPNRVTVSMKSHASRAAVSAASVPIAGAAVPPTTPGLLR
jgi:hypothetical protein